MRQKAQDWFNQYANIEELRDSILNGFNRDRVVIKRKDENYIYFHTSLVPAYYRHSQIKKVAEYFYLDDIKDADYDELVEVVESFTDELSSILTKEINKAGLSGSVHFGHNENTGDYGLQYIVSIGDVEYDEDGHPTLQISFDTFLDELYKLTVVEQERSLTEEETIRYLELYEMLCKHNVEIPFGVNI